MNEVPPKPEFSLPRLGYDTPEEKAEKRWHSYFDGFGGFPERPEAFDLLLIEKERHEAYMSRVEEGGIPWEDAKRKAIGVGVKIDGLVESARKTWAARVDPEAVAKEVEETEKWREVRERTPEEIQAAVDKELAQWEEEVAAKKAKARARQEKAELEAGAREGLESPTETEEEDRVKAEAKLDRMAGYMGEEMRRHTGKVVPLRTVAERDANVVEGGESKAPFMIDLISDLDLYAKHFDDLVFLVKDILAAGTLAILAGKPKIGKSFLALQVGRTVAAGEALWDRPTTKVPVLYLGLEDSLRRLKYRMVGQLGVGVRPKGGVHFATLWPRIGKAGEDGIAAMKAAVAELHVGLVIIDTWARFRARMGGPRAGTAYTQDYDDLEPLLDFCRETGVAVLLIHHTKKGDTASIFDLISGSVGLQGAVDCMMVLEGNPIKDAEGGAVGHLSGSARDFDGFELDLEFEKVPGTWKYIGKTAAVRAAGEQEAALEAMRAHGKPVTPTALAKLVDKKLSATKMLLKRMLKARLVAHGEKAGTYVVPDGSHGSHD
jgi:hypothetical protein